MWIITYLESVVIAFFIRCLYIRYNKEANIEEIMKCYQINPRNPEGILFGRLMLYSVFWPWFLSNWILEKTKKIRLFLWSLFFLSLSFQGITPTSVLFLEMIVMMIKRLKVAPDNKYLRLFLLVTCISCH